MEIYMVFPYLEHDLRGLLDAPGVILSMGQMKTYVQQLFQGLDYLHGNHILHRDLKCANLLINNEGILKIGDFGLARPYEPEGHGTLTNMVVTRWYRPPELLLGSTKYTSAIDIWGAGCILAEMIKKKAMFPGASDADQLDYIFKICGSPNPESWPNWRSHLPSSSSNSTIHFKPYRRCLTSTLKGFFERYRDVIFTFSLSLSLSLYIYIYIYI
ncbi:hypothetical protein HMI56_004528 [Coelomomyces lativittatus]|nr:hypothetical protein HMI56_004528 [Coelomomyces lativittatus]